MMVHCQDSSMVEVITCASFMMPRTGQNRLSASGSDGLIKVSFPSPSSKTLMQSLMHARAWKVNRRRDNPVNSATVVWYVLTFSLIFMELIIHSKICPGYCWIVRILVRVLTVITPPKIPARPCFRDPPSFSRLGFGIVLSNSSDRSINSLFQKRYTVCIGLPLLCRWGDRKSVV